MKIYFTVNTTVELICLLTGVLCLYRDKAPLWRFFPLYLFLVCLTEISAIYIRKVLLTSNLPLYNVFILVECFSVSIFFYYLIKKYVNRLKWLLIWLALFLVCYGVEMVSSHYSSFVFKTASLMSFVFVLAGLYFYYLMLKDEKFIKLSTYSPFWWVNGALIFYFGSTATNIFFDYLVTDQVSKFTHSIRYIIFNILNVSLYCCWSYAFICRYLQRKFSSSSVS